MTRTVLITGASRGIGAATARLCAERGWRVGVNYAASAEAATQVVADIEAAGGAAVAVQGDVADPEAVARIFDETERALGPITGVVANAGILGPRGRLADLEPQRMRRIVEVNVFGALLTAREAARRLPPSRGGLGGSIVVVSSAAARIGSPNEFIDYAATKGATDTLVLGLSKELGPESVRVNGVRPGLIDTDIHLAAAAPDRVREMAPLIPMRREGSAQETAEAIVWLLSDAASYVSGTSIDVAGGR